MFRTLIATVLSASLALGAFGAAAPAQAENRDLQRLLGGVATVIILGAAYDHLRDKKERKAAPVTRHVPRTRYEAPRHVPQALYKSPRQNRDRGQYQRRDARTVPAQCLRQVETRGGTQRFFAQRCLERTMANVHRLPQQCAVRVRGARHDRQGYAPRCLRDYGWRRG